MKKEKVEIKLTGYQRVPITIEERKQDLESFIKISSDDRLKEIKRHNKKLAKLDLDINKMKEELALVRETLK